MRERYECTAETPWRPEHGTPVEHVDAYQMPDSQRDGYPGGDIVTMHCPHCGYQWETELPQ